MKLPPEELLRRCNNFTRLSLQLSQYERNGNEADFSVFPDGWICQAQHRGMTLSPCVTGERGFVFLTRAGFEANIPLIKSMVKDDWPEFEQKAKKHFEDMERGREMRQKLFERKALLYKEVII
jgi:hypothetical protein